MTRVRTPALTFAAVALAVAAVMVPLPATAQREKDEAFKTGLDARKDKQWSAVVTEMRRAIQEDAKESTRKVGRGFLGAGGTEYLPYYFLGEAYFRQNDCANAVVAWENSTRQGVVRTKNEYFGELQKGSAQCEAKGVLLAEKFEAAVARGRTQLEGANGAMTKVKEKGTANIDVWRSRPAFDAEYQRASTEYDTARKHFNDAQRSRLESDFSEVAKSAERVKELVDAVEKDLNTAIERGSAVTREAASVRRTIEEARKIDLEIETKASVLSPEMKASRADGQKKLEIAREQLDPRRLSESTIASARTSVTEGVGLLQNVLDAANAIYAKVIKQKLDRATGLATAAFSRADAELATLQTLIERNPAKATQEIRDNFEAARKQLDSAKRRRDAAIRSQQVAGVDAAARLADLVQASLVALEQGIGVDLTLEDRGVPTWLQAGAARYFEGDYTGALDRLDDGTAEGSAQLHVHLFRAASQYALYVRSGEKDTARRDQAIADVKRCKGLDATFAPDTRAFSPKFIEFYQRDGAPPQSASRTQ
jgi:hypothetical protein